MKHNNVLKMFAAITSANYAICSKSGMKNIENEHQYKIIIA